MNFQQYLKEASVLFGKDFLCEKETINKIYLSKLSGSEESYKEIKSKVDKLWNDNHMSTYIKKSDMILPFLYSQEIKKSNSITDKTMKFLHDLSSAGKLNVLSKLDSDTTPEQFKEFIEQSIKDNLQGGLDSDEETIWKRVKVFHKFDDGFEWVVALDEKGEICGFIPSKITQKTAKHCGNEPSKQEGDHYFELRKNNKPYLTVIINKGLIEESKSYGNQKNQNTDLILSHYKWLLSHEHVKGVGQRYNEGYAPDMNMGLKDFLGKDDDFIAHMEKTKPDLMGKTDKVIIDTKRKLESGSITEEDVIKMFKDKEIKFWELRGILGKIPFSEKELIQMIKNDELNDLDIANTDTKLLTIPVQHTLVDTDNYGYLIDVYNAVPTAKIDIGYILAHDDDILIYVSEDKRTDLVLKYKDIFTNRFWKSPKIIKYIPIKDRTKVIKQFEEVFEYRAKKEPSLILAYVADEDILELYDLFEKSFLEGFSVEPSAVEYIPLKDLESLFIDKIFKSTIKTGFENHPREFKKLSDDNYATMIAKKLDLHDLYDRYF